MARKYYVYDHWEHDWCNTWCYDNFGDFMDFIENGYDPERHSVQDSLRSHNECCKNNDNEIEKGCQMIRESITKEQYKQIRTRLKYTQAEFATELGIDKQTVSRHETGERGISKTIAILIGYIFEKQKQERKMKKFNYIVWVGATPDYYINYEDAIRDYNDWIDKGYDDVVLEKIN